MKTLSIDADTGAADSHGTEAPAHNLDKLKEELQAANIQQFNQMQENILSNVKSMLTGFNQGHKENESVADEDSVQSNLGHHFSDMRDDFEALGVDDDEKATALMNIVNKVVKKQVPTFEKKILGAVDQKEAHRNRKAELDFEARRAYPAVLDPNSALFQMTKRIWDNEMSPELKNSPDGTSAAIARAAQRLGITPLTAQQIRQAEAQNPTGDGPGGKPSKDAEPSQSALDFASAFGVNTKVFKEKLKLVSSK